MKRYIKDGVIKGAREISVLKTIETEREVTEYIPIEGESEEDEGARIPRTEAVTRTEKVVSTVRMYNPSEEDILRDGWEVYETPVYEPTLEEVKAQKIAEIEAYDQSEEVNAIMVDGEVTWIAKADRVGLAHLLDVDSRNGQETETFWFGVKAYSVTIEQGVKILDAIEAYAKECYNATQRHIAAVKEMEGIEDIKNYDATLGYPEKLIFNF